MRKYVAEFIGTFFLVSAVGHTGVGEGAGMLAPLAIGAMLLVMVFAGGHLSGAHYNPAVTLAVWLRGRIPWGQVPGYWVAQVLGAWGASVGVLAMKPGVKVLAVEFPQGVGVPLAAEFLGTFALAYVVLNVATARANADNGFYGLAIGFTVLSCALVFGEYSGGAFNPAVAVGMVGMGLARASELWVYLVADLLAAGLAAVVFRTLSPGDVESSGSESEGRSGAGAPAGAGGGACEGVAKTSLRSDSVELD
jgi:aquaporin Z